jgi:hypothetical protein
VLSSVEPVKEAFNGQTVWEGLVHVFDLEGHPKATRAYAWSSPVDGSDKPTVLCRAAPGRHPVAARCGAGGYRCRASREGRAIFMNPLQWKREHQAALCIAMVLGAVVGVLTLYVTTKTSSGDVSLWLWLRGWEPVFWWGGIGAAIGAGIVYVRHLLRAKLKLGHYRTVARLFITLAPGDARRAGPHHASTAPRRLSSRPGRAPVCSPPSITTVPLTITVPMPAGYWCGSS